MPNVTGVLAGVATALAVMPDPTFVTKVAAAAVAATGVLASGLANSESTNGMKRHILRQEDGTRPTRIVLKPEGVVFDSKSGNSETGARVVETTPA